MVYLPFEILIKIFRQLHHQFDKVECMLVCHHWKQIIENYVLFHTNVIHSGEELSGFLEKVQKYPDIATRIEQFFIIFSDRDVHRYTLSKLLFLLPNLRKISFPTDWYYNTTKYDSKVYPWYECIKHFSNSQRFSLILSVLSSNLCPNLTALSVFLHSNNNLPSLLHNAPNLQILELYDGYCSLADLNVVHDKLPHLRSFTITIMKFSVENIDEMVIIPATSVFRLVFQRILINSPTAGSNLLSYVTKKYPNLVEFGFSVKVRRGIPYNDNQLGDMITGRWASLLDGLGYRLKRFRIDYNSEKDALFERLDATGCQLNHLEIYPFPEDMGIQLAKSQQIQSIQSLSLLNWQFKNCSWLKGFRVLKELKLSCERDKIDGMPYEIEFEKVLANVPSTLRSLTIVSCYLDFDLRYTDVSQITTLAFETVDYNITIDTFIDQCFPNLSELEIRKCTFDRQELNLPSINLHAFRFSPDARDQVYKTLIMTRNNNESRMYSVRYKPYYGTIPKLLREHGRPYKSYLTNEKYVSPGFTLDCNSLKNIYFMY